MKPLHHTTAPQASPSVATIGQWALRLHSLHQRLAPHFARREPLHHALLYLKAIMSDIPRKNGWQIAEHARLERPYRIQRLLSRAVWDHDGVRDVVRSFLCECLQPPATSSAPAEPDALFPLLVIDESAFPKQGRHSAGVAPQYCGLTGRVENCQVGVFLSFVTARGHGLIDRELYLPEVWCQDAPRRHAAHIPDAISFQTKPELGKQMVERALAAGIAPRWVVADTVYGHSTDLRLFLEAQNLSCALAVPSHEVVCVSTPGRPRLGAVSTLAHELLVPHDWQRLSASPGTKGERFFDWAMLALCHQGTRDPRRWLVVRRCVQAPYELAYYLVFAPLDTPLSLIAQAIGARWHIEEDLQTAKDLGLDHYEVRSFVGWYRHLTLVLLAAAFLRDLCVQDQLAAAQSSSAAPVPLVPLTPSEACHLLARLLWPLPTSALLVAAWSAFRRHHQYWAGYYHRRRREKTALAATVPLVS